MKINTYAVNCNDAWLNTEGDDISGSYVKYKDHQALVAELEAKCAALAAENAGLNEKMDKLATWPGIEFYSSAWEFNGGDGDAALEFMCDVQTPAIDSFLAEVRASTSDEICLKIRNAITNCYQDEQVGLDAAATICGEFAAQIRNGASA